jgi:hypothetical protein
MGRKNYELIDNANNVCNQMDHVGLGLMGIGTDPLHIKRPVFITLPARAVVEASFERASGLRVIPAWKVSIVLGNRLTGQVAGT